MRLIFILIGMSYTSTSAVALAMMYPKTSSIGYTEYTHTVSTNNNYGYPQPYSIPKPVIPTLKNPDNPVLIPLSQAGFKPVFPPFGYHGNSYTEGRRRYPHANSNDYHDNKHSMSYLPLFLGGDQGRELAAYTMMMNSNGNSMFPFFPVNNVDNVGLLPMINFANGGEMGAQDLNPFVMSAFFEYEM